MWHHLMRPAVVLTLLLTLLPLLCLPVPAESVGGAALVCPELGLLLLLVRPACVVLGLVCAVVAALVFPVVVTLACPVVVSLLVLCRVV